jgi:hypothetical protein
VIHLVDQALEGFVRGDLLPPDAGVDLSFATPDKQWGSGITRPTINLFLWDVKRSAVQAQSGSDTIDIDGQISRRTAPVSVELRYLVTAWATEGRDEHQLLGTVLQGVLGTPTLPERLRPEGLGDTGPVRLQVASANEPRSADFWTSLGGQLKPGIDLRVELRVAAFAWESAALPATAVETTVNPIPRPAAPRTATPVTDTGVRRRYRRHGAVVTEATRTRPDDQAESQDP